MVLTLLTNSMVAYAIARNMQRRLFKGAVLLLRLRAVRAVPDHHAAGGEGDGDARTWTTGSGLILLYVVYGLAFNIFIFTAYIQSIPRELEEAARNRRRLDLGRSSGG